MRIVNPDLVKVKPKPTLAVLDPEVVVKKKRAQKKILMPPDQMGRKKVGLQEDGIPPGTLCYLRKRARELYGFDYCTVLKTTVSLHGKVVWVEVLTPDGKVTSLDVMWLRNVDVQNGNVDEE